MDVRVEAGILTAKAVAVDSTTTVEIISNIVIASPVVSCFSLAPVISVGGNSISSINPEYFRIGEKALA